MSTATGQRSGAGPAAVLLGLLAGASAVVLALPGRRPPRGRAPTPTGWPVVFAHRGGRWIVPEDTVEGFREALRRCGDLVVELDVRVSADGAVVVVHDELVDRTTDGTGPVAGMTLAELQRLDAGYRFTPDGGATFPWRGRGVRIPTLAEVYRQFPGRPVNVELKGEDPDLEHLVWRVIEEAGAQERTLVVATRGGSIRRFRRACGGAVATGASVGEFIAYRLLALLRLTRLHPAPFQALQPPDTLRGVRITTPRLVRTAQADGLRVDVWTVDAAHDMRRLLGWGVDGIITDRPDVLAGVLGEG